MGLSPAVFETAASAIPPLRPAQTMIRRDRLRRLADRDRRQTGPPVHVEGSVCRSPQTVRAYDRRVSGGALVAPMWGARWKRSSGGSGTGSRRGRCSSSTSLTGGSGTRSTTWGGMAGGTSLASCWARVRHSWGLRAGTRTATGRGFRSFGSKPRRINSVRTSCAGVGGSLIYLFMHSDHCYTRLSRI